jgi:hypothetical protein
MAKGDKVFIDGKEFTVTWSSDEMTDEERYQSHMRTAEIMEQHGLSGAMQRHLAEQYRQSEPNT